MQTSNINERADNEFYTPESFCKKHIEDYDYIFSKYDKIWIPFSKKTHPMYKILYKKYGNKIITTPDKFYDIEIKCNNFFKCFDKDNNCIIDEVINNKTLVFDNPPFSEFTKIVKLLNKNNIQWMLYAGTLCGSNKIKYGGWDILGRVKFYNRNNWVNVSIFSPLFDKIKYNFGYSQTDKLLNVGKRTLESYNGHLSSSEIVNVCQRGYVLNINDYRYEKGKEEHKFGGSILIKN